MMIRFRVSTSIFILPIFSMTNFTGDWEKSLPRQEPILLRVILTSLDQILNTGGADPSFLFTPSKTLLSSRIWDSVTLQELFKYHVFNNKSRGLQSLQSNDLIIQIFIFNWLYSKDHSVGMPVAESYRMILALKTINQLKFNKSTKSYLNSPLLATCWYNLYWRGVNSASAASAATICNSGRDLNRDKCLFLAMLTQVFSAGGVQKDI